jgi:hypothetical protein
MSEQRRRGYGRTPRPSGSATARSTRFGLTDKIVRVAAGPVIALIQAPDPAFVKEASKRGVFAYITDADARDWQSSIDIVLRRVPRPRRRLRSPCRVPDPGWARLACPRPGRAGGKVELALP